MVVECLRGVGGSIVALVGLSDDTEIRTHAFKGSLGLQSLMGVEVALEFDVDETGGMVHKNAATAVQPENNLPRVEHTK